MLYVCGNKSDLIDSGERLREVSLDEAVSYGQGICNYTDGLPALNLRFAFQFL